jgi:hypothetical protein
MGAQFRCENHNRRQLILDPPSGATLNAIDYLEVLDHDAPSGTPRQQTLLVWLFRPVPAALDASHVVISGGVRETDITVVWAQPASAVTAPGEPGAFYGALPHADQIVVVRTDRAGDFSTYTLELVGLAGFDPILSRVDFSFKVECPSSFDCAPAVVCPPPPAVEPAIDYLAKDYASFRRVMLDRLATVMPDWRQRSPADTGVAVVEALAYVADHLSYQQDAVATEAYLGTARHRVSVRRHARLLDYRMHEGTNARAWLCIEVAAASDGLVLKRQTGATRTIFFTRAVEAVVVDADRARALLLGAAPPQVFEPMEERALYRAHNRIAFYTWGDDRCCLPRGATRATLQDDLTARLMLAPGDVLVFEEALGGDTGLAADADPTRRHAVRLTKVTPPALVAQDLTRTPGAATPDPVTATPVVEIEWDDGDALPAPFCVSKVIGGKVVDGMSVVRGNVVLVDHGRTQPDEPVDPATVPAAGRYQPVLSQPELTHAAPLDPAVAAAAALLQDPRAAVPQIALTGPGGTPWTVQPDLLRSDRFAADFVVEIDDGGAAALRFGDGVLGREPEDGLVASYRTGRGRGGNVGAEAIAHAVCVGLHADAVRNPLPARGGIDPETLQQVKLYAPQAFRVQERAVTEADYAAAAERHPHVLKAVATRRWTGSWYTMFVTVDRRGGRPVDAAFQDVMLRHLARFRLAGHDLEIEPPRMVPLDLTIVACVKPGFFRDKVQRALLAAYAAFFAPDHFTFAQPIYLSHVVGIAMRVPGVDWVDPTDPRFVFQRFAQPPNHELENGVIPMARLEIARCDNSPSLPENGRLQLVLMGGK